MREQNKQKSQLMRGYTLVEILLVIALMATLTSVGIMGYRQHSQSSQSDKNAVELQNVLQAAMAYNIDHSGTWPKPHWDQASCYKNSSMGSDADFTRDYLPNSTNMNGYGTYFCFSPSGNNGSRFAAAMKVPGANATEMQQNAKRIRAQLPNAVVTSDLTAPSDQPIACTSDTAPCFVRAEIPKPGASSNAQAGILVVGTGYCVPNSPLGKSGIGQDVMCAGDQNHFQVRFHCPGDMQGRVVLMPNFIKAPYPDGDSGIPLVRMQSSVSYPVCSEPDADGIVSCNIDMTENYWASKKDQERDATQFGGQNPGQIGASYIAVCIPSKTS